MNPGIDIPGLDEFRRDYPLMALRPRAGDRRIIKGQFRFIAVHAEAGKVEDSFDLDIHVPRAFPRELPKVVEIGGRIPRTGGFHINQFDGSLCLGSPVHLLLKLSSAPTLCGFAEKCLVPYLFAISQKLNRNADFPFGELAHGAEGALADYQCLFGLESKLQALSALALLATKKRVANKRLCPCGCGKRLGKCAFNTRIRSYRALANRAWFLKEFSSEFGSNASENPPQNRVIKRLLNRARRMAAHR